MVRLFLNVSGLEQTIRFLRNKVVLFHLDAPSSQAGARNAQEFDMRIGSPIKFQAEFQTAARRDSSEDSMKKAFLLIVVSALLVALGSAQTPAASSNTDQTNIRGCLGGSDDNYTVAEDNTGQIFKITTSSVDLKPHLGHDVKLVGHKASGAVSSGTADNSLAVTELSMISEHCAGAAAAPVATVSTNPETVVTPAAPAAAATAAAPVSAPSETATTPPVAPNANVITPAADTAAATAAAPVSAPSESATAPAAAPNATVDAPAATVNPPAATINPSSETDSTPAAATSHPTRPSPHPRKQLATPAAAAATPAATINPHTADAATPASTASTPSETDSTPAAAATTPTVTHKGGSLWLFIPFVVLLIALGTLVPLLIRWRKRKLLEQTSAQNLSLTHNPSSDPGKSDTPVVVHKAA